MLVELGTAYTALFVEKALMGLMRFHICPPDRISDEMAQHAYLSGIDRIAWPVRTSVDGDMLLLQRGVSDSGNLHIPWFVKDHGLLMLTTCSLMERNEPYWLPVELARGTLCQVRNQLAEWQLMGLNPPPAVGKRLAMAVDKLSWAVVEESDLGVSARYAEDSLCAALDAANLLTAAYAEQTTRWKKSQNTAALLGADLGMALLDEYASRQFLATFNAAESPICWRDVETTEGNFQWATTDRQIEWCRAHGVKVLAGPLLLFDRRALPDWLSLFEDDFEDLVEFVSTYIQTVVKRYRGKVDGWICAGRVNADDVLDISEQDRVRLVAHTVELVRSLDPVAPVMVSFDQPWGEYLRQRHSDFPPLHFADALIRADLGLGGLMLEINVGSQPGGTMPRQPLDFQRQIDAWTRLGLPLWLSLSSPGGQGDDPLALRKSETAGWSATPEMQQSWASRILPLALGKPAVQGIIWNQLSDNLPHDFPHAGLFDAAGRAKPTMHTLATIRQALLK
jgi:hypothetical protein